MEKKCIDCKITKSTDDFYKSSTHSQGVMSYCKQCFNNRCIKRWIQRKIDAIIYLGNKCDRCNLEGTNDNYCIFDFHHLNPEEKDAEWSKLRLKSKAKIQQELDKCILLCSNCHRLEHHNQLILKKTHALSS